VLPEETGATSDTCRLKGLACGVGLLIGGGGTGVGFSILGLPGTHCGRFKGRGVSGSGGISLASNSQLPGFLG
jgi:hypothetical protein